MSRLGLAKIGVIPALINTNLRNESLVHTITTASSRTVLYGVELEKGQCCEDSCRPKVFFSY